MAAIAGRNLVRLNREQLARQLHERGKALWALRESKAVSADTLAKINRGEPVKPIILQQILAQLAKWPVLKGSAALLEEETPTPEEAAR